METDLVLNWNKINKEKQSKEKNLFHENILMCNQINYNVHFSLAHYNILMIGMKGYFSYKTFALWIKRTTVLCFSYLVNIVPKQMLYNDIGIKFVAIGTW